MFYHFVVSSCWQLVSSGPWTAHTKLCFWRVADSCCNDAPRTPINVPICVHQAIALSSVHCVFMLAAYK